MSDRPELHMERFCGPEVYEVVDAGWNLYPDEDDGVITLCISLQCGEAIKQCDDTEYIGGSPYWELNLVDNSLTEARLAPGFRAEIPKGYDESRGGWITNFYFSEHAGSDKNTIEILKAINGVSI